MNRATVPEPPDGSAAGDRYGAAGRAGPGGPPPGHLRPRPPGFRRPSGPSAPGPSASGPSARGSSAPGPSAPDPPGFGSPGHRPGAGHGGSPRHPGGPAPHDDGRRAPWPGDRPTVPRRERVGPVPRWLQRSRAASVGLARVFAGGLVVLALVVLGAPHVLGGPGPGSGIVVAHVTAALVAVAATAVAAHPRTPPAPAVGAGLVVPVTVLVLLGSVWWA